MSSPSPRTLAALLLAPALVAACGGDEQGPSTQDAARAERERLEGPAPGLDELSPPPEELAIPADAPVVAFLGDSICAGLHLPEHLSFPRVLQRTLFAEGLPFRLVSACESGRTSAGARTALPWVLRSEPDVLVLEIGGNDGLRGIPLAELEQNLRAVVEGAQAAGARVVLLGVRLWENYGDYGERLAALYPELAQEYGTLFVPFFMEGVGGVPTRNLEDGMHPNPAGHERLAENVAPTLAEALRALGEGGERSDGAGGG